VAAVRTLPGVVDAALTSLLPLGGNYDSWGVHRVDRPGDNPSQSPSALRYGTAGDFARTMGLRLVRGRTLTAEDDRSPHAVVLINETFARRVYPGEDPLGKQIRLGGNDGPPRTIVGVVADVRHERLDESALLQVYGPERQWRFADQFLTMVVRTDGDPMAIAASVRNAIWSVDRTVPISRVAPMPRIIAGTTAVRRFAMLIFGVFAGVALLLAASGLYGVLSASVSERTREIGIRGALGASRERILRLVVTQSARFTLVGLACGLLLAIWGSRFLASLLYGVSPFDPVTLIAVVITLCLVAGAAAVIPAVRAARVDPSIALRAG
jgi:putative ABC transport system permease protein